EGHLGQERPLRGRADTRSGSCTRRRAAVLRGGQPCVGSRIPDDHRSRTWPHRTTSAAASRIVGSTGRDVTPRSRRTFVLSKRSGGPRFVRKYWPTPFGCVSDTSFTNAVPIRLSSRSDGSRYLS